MKVLIVEDDLIIARIYQNLLRLEGLEVEVAVDGEAALHSLERSRPDLILLDLMLPKINGVAVLRRVRSGAATHDLPVIVFSNASLSGMLEEAASAGATACVVKSETTPKKLVQLIRQALAGERLAGTTISSGHTHPDFAGTRDFTMQEEALDPTFQYEIGQALLKRGPETLITLRSYLQTLLKSAEHEQKLFLQQLLDCNDGLLSHAKSANFSRLAQMGKSLQALLKELYDKPDKINPSALRTLAQALDSLETLFEMAARGENKLMEGVRILVVDDDDVALRVICMALTRVGLSALSLTDPAKALHVLENNPFDLVFLDINMPGINGFDVCKHLRACKMNATTPVVFVTAVAHFANRALSTLCGGNDFVAKPFSFAELAVKAFVYALRSKNPASAQRFDPTALAAKLTVSSPKEG